MKQFAVLTILAWINISDTQDVSNTYWYTPRFLQGPGVHDVAIGQIKFLNCVLEGPSSTSVFWNLNKKKITNSKTFHIRENGRVLKIQVSEETEGQYCCMANVGPRLIDSRCGALHIEKAPRVSLKPESISVPAGSPINFHCMVTGRPTPKLTWSVNNKTVRCSGKNLRITSLCSRLSISGNHFYIHNSTLLDNGSYQCRAWNRLGIMSSNIVGLTVKRILTDKDTESFRSRSNTSDIISWLLPLSLIFFGICILFPLTLLCKKYRRNISTGSIVERNMKDSKSAIEHNRSDTHEIQPCFLQKLMQSEKYKTLKYVSGEYKIIKELGKGLFGKVYQAKTICEYENTEVVVAMKSLHTLSADSHVKIFREAMVLCAFSHSNIVQFFGVYVDSPKCSADVDSGELNPPFLVFEFIDGGDLCTRLRDLSHKVLLSGNDKMKEHDIDQLGICFQISKGMGYLSQHYFVHRDLATRNCLLSSCGHVKIADFGLARKLSSSDYYKSGDAETVPIRWMSPESLMFGRYSSFSDVWSFGVCMWEIYTYAMQPYVGSSNQQVIEAVLQGSILPKPALASDCLYRLMRSCWSFAACDRPNFDQISTLLSLQRDDTRS